MLEGTDAKTIKIFKRHLYSFSNYSRFYRIRGGGAMQQNHQQTQLQAGLARHHL